MTRGILTTLSIFCLATSTARALPITIDPPRDREFVRDLANVIDANDEQRIKQLADQLLTDTATPIIVVTIDSMANHGGRMRIETFATLLFDQWGVGHKQLDGREWNTGILLLVSKNDRKARIELGGGWRRDHDLRAGQIMEQDIIPKFKQGQFSKGILAGVESLDRMTRGVFGPLAVSPNTAQQPAPAPQSSPTPRPGATPAPAPPGSPGYSVERDPSKPEPTPAPAPSSQTPPPVYRPSPPSSPRSSPGVGLGACACWPFVLVIGFMILMSILRSGARRPGYGMSGGTTGLLGALIYSILASGGNNRGYSSTWRPRYGGSSGFSFGGGHRGGISFGGGGGGGRSLGSRGFGGGSFGGGHSGGGGATGSW